MLSVSLVERLELALDLLDAEEHLERKSRTVAHYAVSQFLVLAIAM